MRTADQNSYVVRQQFAPPFRHGIALLLSTTQNNPRSFQASNLSKRKSFILPLALAKFPS